MVRTGTTTVAQKADGTLASAPAPLTIKDVENQPSGSPEQTVSRLIFWAQWGNLPAVVDLYERTVVATLGVSTLAGTYDYLRPDLLTSQVRVVSTRSSAGGVFVSLKISSTSNPPRHEGFLLVRRNDVWRVVYDTLLERALVGYTISQQAPGDETPSIAVQRSATRAAATYRQAYASRRQQLATGG